MGGFGSGRGPRHKARKSTKLKTSSLPALVIPQLITLHKVHPNSTFTFGDIRLTVAADRFSVQLERTTAAKSAIDTIKIAALACHFGGSRYFAHCPLCQKRVRTLYLAENGFACRHCLQLGYRSQNERLADRLFQQRRAIGEKINNDETKPKWMREKTFAKLREVYHDLDEKEQIANFFSLRNNRAVNTIFDQCGSAVIAAEIWEMETLGRGRCHPALLPFYDYFLREAQQENRTRR